MFKNVIDTCIFMTRDTSISNIYDARINGAFSIRKWIPCQSPLICGECC